MKQFFYLVILVLIFSSSCKKEPNTTYLISQTHVGKLEKKSLARDIDVIFSQDSIVRDTFSLQFGNGAKKIKIYEKGGAHMLTLTPSSDSIPTIENIHVLDPRYKTETGIDINSSFKDIKEKYAIRKIQTSINNVVIFIKNSDIYFTIDKKELPSNLRYVSSVNIEAVQIPDAAKIKYMMVGWD